MIWARVFKIEDPGYQCEHPECEHNEKYHYNILGQVFHIKQGTLVLRLTLGNNTRVTELYCRDCIDKVYNKLKPVLNSNLWPFK